VGVQAGRPWAARDLLATWGRVFGIIAAVMLVLGAIAVPWIQRLENISSPWPVRMAVLVFVSALFAPLLVGTFQGVQKFVWMSLAQAGWSIFRLIVAILLLFLVAKQAWCALFAHFFGTVVGLALSALGIRQLAMRPDGEQRQHHPLGGYFQQSFLTLIAYAILTYGDLLLVSHFYPKAEAGEFARAALIGRSVIFLPIPIAMAMFPKVVSVGASSRRTLVTLFKALAMVAAMIGLAVLVCTFFTWLPLRIMFGIKEAPAEQMHFVRTVLWAMAPLTLTYMLVNFEMAQHRFRSLPFLWICVLGYVGGVWAFHDTLAQFVAILGTVSTVSALCLTAFVVRAHLRNDGMPATHAA
jgi:O-antigen/teichoic acid export membrane protein